MSESRLNNLIEKLQEYLEVELLLGKERIECSKSIFEDINESQQFILRFTLMEFANYFKDKDAAKAITMMDYGKHLFYDENYFSKISYSMDYKLIYDHL